MLRPRFVPHQESTATKVKSPPASPRRPRSTTQIKTRLAHPCPLRKAAASALMVPDGGDPLEWRKLEIKESGVPEAGLGLFAREAFVAGEIACDYRGTVLTLMQCIRLTDRSYVRKLNVAQ